MSRICPSISFRHADIHYRNGIVNLKVLEIINQKKHMHKFLKLYMRSDLKEKQAKGIINQRDGTFIWYNQQRETCYITWFDPPYIKSSHQFFNKFFRN